METRQWDICKHATPEHSPQYGVYENNDRNDFCIVTGEDAEAKAQLISAAPNLLEACKHVRDNLSQESKEVWEIEIAHLETAIAKAENQ